MSFDFFNDNSDTRPESAKSQETPISTAEMHDNENKDIMSLDLDEKSEEVVSEQPTEVMDVSEDESTKEEQPSEVEENIKQLSAQFNDNELNVPAEAVFKHKVDGEEVDVSLQELLNNYSGKQAWDKKFSELDKERSIYKQDLDMVNKYIGEFASLSKENPTKGMEFLAKFAGLDPLQYRRQMRDQFIQEYGQYLQMGEDERRIMDLKEENEYYKQMRESEQKRLMEQQAHQELENQFRSAQEAHKISDERRSLLENDLRAYMKAQGIQGRISPQDIVSLHNAYVAQDRAIEALNKVNPELVNDGQKLLVAESLLKGNPQMSDSELENQLARMWGDDVKKATKELETRKPKKEQPREQTYAPKRMSANSVDFFE
jgi:hypothetical protein